MNIFVVSHHWGDDGTITLHRTFDGARRAARTIILETDHAADHAEALDEIEKATEAGVEKDAFVLDLGEPTTLTINIIPLED